MAEQENSRGHGLLGGLELAGLQELSLRKQEFEPIESRTKIGRVIAHWLVQAGLAEVVPCSDALTAQGYKEGYRLTALGRETLEQSRLASQENPQA